MLGYLWLRRGSSSELIRTVGWVMSPKRTMQAGQKLGNAHVQRGEKKEPLVTTQEGLEHGRSPKEKEEQNQGGPGLMGSPPPFVVREGS